MRAQSLNAAPSLADLTDLSHADWLQDHPDDHRKPVLNNKIDRIFILGAGASIPYGLSTLKTLTWEILQTLSEPKRTIFLQAVFECFNVNLRRVEDSPDFEELLNRLDPAALRYLAGIGLQEETTPRFNAAEIALWSLREFIRNRCLAVARTLGPYDRLVACLDERTAIVSFNWDVLLDVALQRAGREFRYLPTVACANGTILLKPHGSINWFALLHRELLYVAEDSNLEIFGRNLYYYLLHVKEPLAQIQFGRSL